MNEKESDQSKEQQIFKRIHEMERKCHEQINEQEKLQESEKNWRHEKEKKIQYLRANPNEEEKFKEILHKSIADKARDKMKQGKKQEEDNANEEVKKDILLPILKKLGFLENIELDEEQAISVKNECLRNLKERLLTRAEII